MFHVISQPFGFAQDKLRGEIPVTIRLKRCPVGKICSNNAHFSPRMLHLLGCLRDFSASGSEMTYATLIIELGLLDFTAFNTSYIFIPDPGGRIAGVRFGSIRIEALYNACLKLHRRARLTIFRPSLASNLEIAATEEKVVVHPRPIAD